MRKTEMAKVVRFPTKLPAGMVSPRVPAGHCVDPWLEWMRRKGIPLTRENYIATATAGGTTPWTDEHEANLPDELR
jgi:hypothetical protein